MPLHVTDSMFERVGRADEHLADLRERLKVVRRQQEDSILVNFDPEPPHKLVASHFTRTFVGMSVGIRIGEIAYNLRTALEYLVYELAYHDSGVFNEKTQFPIEDKPEGFARRKTGIELRGINAAHVAAIERLQPYNGCNWTKALRDISNRDKHRAFVEIGGHSEAWIYLRPEETDFDRIDAPIRRTPHPDPGIGAVDVKVYVTSAVQFADGTPIMETLEEIKREVTNTLVAFKPEFK